jgi:hypothetical protein
MSVEGGDDDYEEIPAGETLQSDNILQADNDVNMKELNEILGEDASKLTEAKIEELLRAKIEEMSREENPNGITGEKHRETNERNSSNILNSPRADQEELEQIPSKSKDRSKGGTKAKSSSKKKGSIPKVTLQKSQQFKSKASRKPAKISKAAKGQKSDLEAVPQFSSEVDEDDDDAEYEAMCLAKAEAALRQKQLQERMERQVYNTCAYIQIYTSIHANL